MVGKLAVQPRRPDEIKMRDRYIGCWGRKCTTETDGVCWYWQLCNSWWGHWDFSMTQSFRPHYGHGVASTSNRNEYQWYLLGGRCVELTILPLSCADCVEMLGARTSWNPQNLSRPITGIALPLVLPLNLVVPLLVLFTHIVTFIVVGTKRNSPTKRNDDLFTAMPQWKANMDKESSETVVYELNSGTFVVSH